MKRGRIEFRLPADEAAMFRHRCQQLDAVPSDVLRRLVRKWLAEFKNENRKKQTPSGN